MKFSSNNKIDNELSKEESYENISDEEYNNLNTNILIKENFDFSDESNSEEVLDSENNINLIEINLEEKKEQISNKLNEFIKKNNYKVIEEKIIENSNNKNEEEDIKEKLIVIYKKDMIDLDQEELEKNILIKKNFLIIS